MIIREVEIIVDVDDISGDFLTLMQRVRNAVESVVGDKEVSVSMVMVAPQDDDTEKIADHRVIARYFVNR